MWPGEGFAPSFTLPQASKSEKAVFTITQKENRNKEEM